MVSACGRVAVLAALVVGCDDVRPQPRVLALDPPRAYTDRELRVFVHGDAFVPSFRIDTAGSRIGVARAFAGTLQNAGASMPLSDFGWTDVERLSATLRRGLPPGLYDLTIEDPRGERDTLRGAFLALGADRDRPRVTFVQPTASSAFGPGMTVLAQVTAADEPPGGLAALRWQARAQDGVIGGGTCTIPAGAPEVSCTFEVPVPLALDIGDVVEISATATDTGEAGNETTETTRLLLRARPSLTSIHPSRGGTPGGNDVVVRGSGFVAGSRVFIGDLPLVPNGGIVVDSETITGRTPPHRAGVASLTVRTPIGMPRMPLVFLFQPPPQIQAISPEVGDAEGETAVRVRGQNLTTRTQVYFGASLVGATPLRDPQFVNDGEIQGMAPPGRGRTTVWAFDPELGWTRLFEGFSWANPR